MGSNTPRDGSISPESRMVRADLSFTRYCLTVVCILPDLCFFVIVGVLLFDMVTGIIVDTFASCREETEHRSHALENTCFICDIDREKVSTRPDAQATATYQRNFVLHRLRIWGRNSILTSMLQPSMTFGITSIFSCISRTCTKRTREMGSTAQRARSGARLRATRPAGFRAAHRGRSRSTAPLEG